MSPRTVPYLGGNSPQRPPDANMTSTSKNCQFITGVSDIKFFGIWVDTTSATPTWVKHQVCSVQTDGSVITCVPLGGTVNAANIGSFSGLYTFSLYQSAIHAYGLAPGNTYGICTTANSGFTLNLAVTFYGSGGATLNSDDTIATTGNDVYFNIITTNLLTLKNANYFDGYGGTEDFCLYRTFHSAVRVRWDSLLVQTGYLGSAVSYGPIYSYGTCYGGLNLYATPDTCANGQTAYGQIDLTDTNYKIASGESWTSYGYANSGSASVSPNGQTVSMWVSGYCAYLWTTESAAVNYPSYSNNGGWMLQLAHV